MKKWIGILITAYLLLTLCGCAQAPELPTNPDVPVHETPVQTDDETVDVGQAETRVDPYARTAIIARNAWLEGGFTQTKQWALEYALQKYPHQTEVTATYNSGYVMPDAMVPEESLSGGVAVWDLTVKQGDSITEESVQIFYFSERGSDGYQICFSGLLADGDIRKTRPEGYAYLMLDTRFSGRLQSLPQLDGPEGAMEVEVLLESEATDQQFYPLSDHVVAVLCRYSRRYLSDDKLLVYNLESGEVLLEEWLSGFWGWADGGDGWITLEHYYAEDEEQLCARIILAEDGVQLEWFSRPYHQYQVGEAVLTWKDERVLLDEEVLLGDPGFAQTEQSELQAGEELQEPVEPQEAAMYNFHQALDGHRFLFSKATVEWIEYYGIYDLETQTVQVLAGRLQPWDFHVLQVSADGSRALMGYGSYGYWGLTLIDLQTMEQRLLPLEYGSEDHSVERVTANADLSRIAVMDLGAEGSGVDRMRVFDTESGEELFCWDVPERLIAGEPEFQLTGEHTLLVNVRQWKTDTEWVYRVTY